MKRAIRISSPPRSVTWRWAHSTRLRAFSPLKKRSLIRVPKRAPIKYEVLSPRNAPEAAAAITRGRLRPPVDATTPAVITVVALGTTGTNASRDARRATIRYAQPEAFETRSVNWLEIADYPSGPGFAGEARPIRRPHFPELSFGRTSRLEFGV